MKIPDAALQQHIAILGETKACTRCREVKPLSQFSTNWNKKLNRDCIRSHCRACDVEKCRAYRATEAGKASRTREHRRQFTRNYAMFKAIKACLRCCTCGESDPCCIDFHHVDPAAKRFVLHSAIRTGFQRLRSELLKCICLCANCHRKLHAKRLVLTAAAKTIGAAEVLAAVNARIAATFDDGAPINRRLIQRHAEAHASLESTP